MGLGLVVVGVVLVVALIPNVRDAVVDDLVYLSYAIEAWCRNVISNLKESPPFAPSQARPQTHPQTNAQTDAQTNAQPNPQPKPQPTFVPIPVTPSPDDRSKVIVELGAGDYTNAINMKLRNPNDHVIATNSYEDWDLGKRLFQGGYSAADYYQVGFYEGWQKAATLGVDVGLTSPYENNNVGTGVADLVYTILPYPTTAYNFGYDAARIAKTQSGTRVAITAASEAYVANEFIAGFRHARPGADFIKVSGAIFGNPGGHAPGQTWEPGPFYTWIYQVP